MKRREFIAALGTVAVAVRPAVAAQRTTPRAVGFLGAESADLWEDRVRAFHEGLREAGQLEGQDITIEYRWAEGRYDRLPSLAADLVRRRVSVIVAIPTQSALAAKAATATTPIVFVTGGDPVKLGLVAGLSRPGGNATGVVNLNVDLSQRRLELLRELLPALRTVALLIDPTNINANSLVAQVQTAAQRLGLQLHTVHATSERDFDAVFANLAKLRVDAFMIGTEGFLVSRSVQLADRTVRHRIPTIFQFREYVVAGGLMSYGGSARGNFRQVGVYTGRILNGEQPSDLPVEQSSTLELIINGRTAKTLGITVPQALLARADEVIE
jgi:putative ABC transport system substrate-binding protein